MIFVSVTVQLAQPEDDVTADVRASRTVETAVVDKTLPLYADGGSSDSVKDASTDVFVDDATEVEGVKDGVGLDELDGIPCGVCGLLDVIEFDVVTVPETDDVPELDPVVLGVGVPLGD